MFSQETCKSCDAFDQNKKVDAPNVLSEIIRDIKEGIEQRILTEVEIDKLKYSEAFDLVSIEGPWNDIVLNYFECIACKKKFKLFANTYQGSPKNGWYTNI